MDTQMTRKHQLWNVIQLPQTLQKFRTAERKLGVLSLGSSTAHGSAPLRHPGTAKGRRREPLSRSLFILHGKRIRVEASLHFSPLFFLSFPRFCYFSINETERLNLVMCPVSCLISYLCSFFDPRLVLFFF